MSFPMICQVILLAGVFCLSPRPRLQPGLDGQATKSGDHVELRFDKYERYNAYPSDWQASQRSSKSVEGRVYYWAQLTFTRIEEGSVVGFSSDRTSEIHDLFGESYYALETQMKKGGFVGIQEGKEMTFDDLSHAIPVAKEGSELHLLFEVPEKFVGEKLRVWYPLDQSQDPKMREWKYTDFATPDDDSPPMLEAVRRGDRETVDSLLSQRMIADVRESGLLHQTALMKAAYWNHAEIVDALLNASADPNATDDSGGTALMAAASEGHSDVARRLLLAGADANAAKKDGNTALTIAALNAPPEFAGLLVKHGANVNARDEAGRTPIMAAAAYARADMVKALVSAGADVNATTINKETPLMFACLKRNPRIGITETDRLAVVKALIEAGANVRAKDNSGSTPKKISKSSGYKKIERLLKEEEKRSPKE